MGDPLSAAIETAVARALDERLPPLLEAAIKASLATLSNSAVEPERFLPMSEVAERLNTTPSTIWRLERAGKYPPRERVGGRVGYKLSTLNAILANIGTAPIPAPAAAIKPGEKRGGRRARASDGEAA